MIRTMFMSATVALLIFGIAPTYALQEEVDPDSTVIPMPPPPEVINPATVPSEGDRFAYSLAEPLPQLKDLPPLMGKVPQDVLILYLTAGLELSPGDFQEAYATRFGVTFPDSPDEKDNQVVGDQELVVVRDGGWDYLVMVQPTLVSQISNLEKVGTNEELMRAVETAGSVVWICSIGVPPASTAKEIHERTGRIVSMFQGHEPLAIYCDGTGDFITWEDDTLALLEAGEFDTLFPSPRRYEAGILPENRPLVQATVQGDPVLVEATRRAQQNWPEFLSAFQTRGEERRYYVRMPFPSPEGDEHLWLRVLNIHGAEITAIVSNAPVSADLKKDQEVTVNLRQLNDWMYFKDGEMQGGFTLQVQKEQAPQSP